MMRSSSPVYFRKKKNKYKYPSLFFSNVNPIAPGGNIFKKKKLIRLQRDSPILDPTFFTQN
jgi:hypothetical protein